MPGGAGDGAVRGRLTGAGLAAGLLALAGCGAPEPAAYQDVEGLRFTPPDGWVQRASTGNVPEQVRHKQGHVPLPPLAAHERLVARYDRVTSGSLAWLRVTRAGPPASASLKVLAARMPGAGWKRESEAEEFELGVLPAARAAAVGRWVDQDYRCETVVVRNGDRVYVITGSFPAADGAAREQVRQAVASATWE